MTTRIFTRLFLFLTALVALDDRAPGSRRAARSDRGDVPGWVLITIVMSRAVTRYCESRCSGGGGRG